jgi:hypothetical protein
MRVAAVEALIATLTMSLVCCGTVARSSRDQLTVCTAAMNAAALSGRVITVRADVVSDLIEHTMLVSDDCPKETISLALMADAAGGDDLKRAIVDGMPDARITATFTGRLEWRPSESPARLLNITEVADVVVQSKR